MIRTAIAALAALVLATSSPLLTPLRAQGQETSVHSRQELARSKFHDLTERMQKLMVLLQKDEPETAKLLVAGTQFVQNKKLQERLSQASNLLQAERWEDALTLMGELRADLNSLYELLQNRSRNVDDLLRKRAQLEQFRDKVDQLAREQGAEKEASARLEALQNQAKAIEAQRQAAQALLQKQQENRDQTNQLGTQAMAEASKSLADKEEQLRQDADQLTKDLADLEKTAAELNAKPDAGKPDAGKPDAGKPDAGKPDAGEPSETKPGKSPSSSASRASQAMGKAQAKLGEGKPEPSLPDQDQAVAALKKTVEQLDEMAEEVRRELLKLPFDQLAKRQEATQHATDTLSKDMEKAEQDGEQTKDPQATPGRKRVQQAVPKQRAAAGQLKEFKDAKQKQQDAKEDLEAAKKELDEALAQLRQQLQDEVLRALEERFTAMLAKQRELTGDTAALDGTRANVLTASGALPAALAERIQGVATGETDLEVEASDALKLLAEEGTTAGFPMMVEDLRDQLHEVARRCRANETDTAVQDRQHEVEDTLELLINALRKTIERKECGH